MIVYIDMDDVICDFTGAFNASLKENPDIIYPQSQWGFYLNLNPVYGAIESVKKLIDLDDIEPYILTAPSIMNPLCYTEKRVWIEKYFGIEFVKNLIISPDKSLLKGDILIDDRVKGHGQDKFDGKLLVFGSVDFPDWKSIIKYLK